MVLRDCGVALSSHEDSPGLNSGVVVNEGHLHCDLASCFDLAHRVAIQERGQLPYLEKACSGWVRKSCQLVNLTHCLIKLKFKDFVQIDRSNRVAYWDFRQLNLYNIAVLNCIGIFEWTKRIRQKFGSLYFGVIASSIDAYFLKTRHICKVVHCYETFEVFDVDLHFESQLNFSFLGKIVVDFQGHHRVSSSCLEGPDSCLFLWRNQGFGVVIKHFPLFNQAIWVFNLGEKWGDATLKQNHTGMGGIFLYIVAFVSQGCRQGTCAIGVAHIDWKLLSGKTIFYSRQVW